jgi:hypothetical protein
LTKINKKDFKICIIKVAKVGSVYIEDGLVHIDKRVAGPSSNRQFYFLKKEADEIIQKIVSANKKAGLILDSKLFSTQSVKLNNIILIPDLIQFYSYIRELSTKAFDEHTYNGLDSKQISYWINHYKDLRRINIARIAYALSSYKEQYERLFCSKSLKLEDIKNNINVSEDIDF